MTYVLGDLGSWLSTYLVHPLTGLGYQWWSGAGSDIGELAILGAMIAAWRKINCHQSGCWRIGRFRHGHFMLCHKHHPLVPDDGRITQEHVDAVGP